jgi:hypothetical protein
MNNTTITFINKSKLKHQDDNGNPRFIYPDNLYIRVLFQKEKVELICTKHGKFNIEPRHHLTNSTGGCHLCRVEKTASSKILKSRLQWEDNILTKHLFEDGTQKYDYSEFIYSGKAVPSTIICIKCKLEGRNYKFTQSPFYHINRSRGCRKCADIINGTKLTTPLSIFIEKCKEKHDNKYNYENIHKTYKTGKSVIEIYCNKCKEYFVQVAEAHVAGRGCHKCGLLQSIKAKYSNTDEFIHKSKQIGNNNINYDYSCTIYENNRKKVNIKCLTCNNIFKITPNWHLLGGGCTICNHRTSNMAREWLRYIQTTFNIILQTFDSDEGEYRIAGTKYSADGYHPATNTIYEFNGDFWHGNPNVYAPDKMNNVKKATMEELYRKTKEKKEKCISLGYKWIEIWEYDWNKLKKQNLN